MDTIELKDLFGAEARRVLATSRDGKRLEMIVSIHGCSGPLLEEVQIVPRFEVFRSGRPTRKASTLQRAIAIYNGEK